MINFLELQIRNFYSYGNNITIIPLKFLEPTLIIGENHDVMIDGEFDANAVGKSSILNALSYVLYGRPITPVKKIEHIINNINKKNLYVALIMEINGRYYKIERWRKNPKMGGTANNGVKITEAETLEGLDDEKNVKTPATRSIDEYISDHIMRMPFEIFARVCVITAKEPPPFLSLPTTSTAGTSQRSIMEELFGQKELTEKSVILKEQIKSTQTDIKQLTDLNARISEEVARYTEQLELAKQSIGTWDATHAAEIAGIKSSIADLEAIDFDSELKLLSTIKTINKTIDEKSALITMKEKELILDDTNGENVVKWDDKHDESIASTEALLSPYKAIDFDAELKQLTLLAELTQKHSDAVAEQGKIADAMDSLYKKIDELNTEIGILQSSKCPYCSQQYHENEDKIAEKLAALRMMGVEYVGHQKAAENIDALIISLSDDMKSVECMFESMADYNTSKNAATALETKLADITEMTNPYTDMMLTETDRLTLESEIDVLKDEVTLLVDELERIGTASYTEQQMYTDQARLEELKKNLVGKVQETNPHEETVERLTKVFDSIDEPRVDAIDELNVLLVHQQFMLKLLTKTDSYLRQSLLNVNLPLLNTRMRHYLDIIGLPHRVEFTKDMTISISQFNSEIGYANLSGGQQARVNLAIAFSFRDVVQQRHQKINLCVLDECLDTGLSNLGVKTAAKMIKQVALENDLSMYVITHRDEIKASFNKSVKAILKGGLTTLEFS